MKLKQIKANVTELELNNGTRVMFSYETPVAAHIPGIGFYRTSQKFSVTTSKHITQWLASHGSQNAETTEQSFFERLIK